MSLFGIGASAVANIAGGILGSAMSSNSAKSNAQLQAQLQRENWEYAQKNAHQFEVEDLKNAGLNPILSATNGQIVGMPSVSGSDNGTGSNVTNALTALGRGLLEKELQSKDLEIENQRLENDSLRIDNETKRNDAEIQLLGTSASKVAAEEKEIYSRIENSAKEVQSLIELRKKQGYLTDAQASVAYKQVDALAGQIALDYERKTGVQLSNEQILRELQNPDSEILRSYRGHWLGNMLGYASQFIKDVTPFRFGVSLPRR